MPRFIGTLLVTIALFPSALFPAATSAQPLRLSRLFTDHAVLQRNMEVPVWGWGTPGADVAVTLGGETFESVVGEDGRWSVELPAMPAGGPHTIMVRAGGERRRVSDVYFGDVWIASGQSNMEWVVDDANDAERTRATANDALVRHFKVPRAWAFAPEVELPGGEWETASPETVGDFSAVGYYFAQHIRQHVGVPIGILNTSWGGSRIEPWMRADVLGLEAEALQEIEADEHARAEEIRQRLADVIGSLPTVDGGSVDGVPVWADRELDDADWNPIAVPSAWESAGYAGLDGIAWYRTAVELTEAEAAAPAVIGLGAIDDSDWSYVNGHPVGNMEWAWSTARRYDVPASALVPGANVITVRVEDGGGGGGIQGSRDLLYLETSARTIPLSGEWKFKVGAVTQLDSDAGKNQLPTLLYNRMVYPLLDYPITGAIWYQGESNAGNAEEAMAYAGLFPDMIAQWRADWGQGDFPFLWVQLANFMDVDAEPAESNWALLRESQTAALALPNTAQAVIIDIGEADDIHPRNKQDVGLRLGLAARHVAYGEDDVVYSGPVYRSHTVDGGRVTVAFDHVGGGLVAGADGSAGGFAIAGPDGRFVWADARIDGDRVVVWSDAVAEPVAVRYAWGNNPDRANLYNAAGLPANPFRR